MTWPDHPDRIAAALAIPATASLPRIAPNYPSGAAG